MSNRPSSSAAPSMAGYLLQVHRAVHNLSKCAEGDLVGVETLDDVTTIDAEGAEFLEQDKLSLYGEPLTDRSQAFWRTLEIWLDAWKDRAGPEGLFCLATNRPIAGPALSQLAKHGRSTADNAAILHLLKMQRAEVSTEGTRPLQGHTTESSTKVMKP